MVKINDGKPVLTKVEITIKAARERILIRSTKKNGILYTSPEQIEEPSL